LRSSNKAIVKLWRTPTLLVVPVEVVGVRKPSANHDCPLAICIEGGCHPLVELSDGEAWPR